MSGNTFGRLFTVTTFGESHGPALGCIVDGCPPGLPLDEALIQPFLDKRRPGLSPYTSQRRESDRVQILSGVFSGKTTGAPIGLLVQNEDAKPKHYDALEMVFRPGHADYTYWKKYGIRDHRGGGRASARETVMRVAAGAIARLYLESVCGITIRGFLSQLGDTVIDFETEIEIDNNPFFCPNTKQLDDLSKKLESLRAEGDSIGARVTVIAQGVPTGLGEPVFDKLNATLAQAMMSINAVKGIEIGAGFQVVTQKGSMHRDAMTPAGFLSNHAGGIAGGISTGQPIEVHLAFKPTSSITLPVSSVNIEGEAVTVSVKGRHDPCVGLRAVPIAEAMMALVLMDHVLRHRAQCAE